MIEEKKYLVTFRRFFSSVKIVIDFNPELLVSLSDNLKTNFGIDCPITSVEEITIKRKD